MTEENSPSEKSKSRIVLGDLTNRVGKRGISERERNKVKRICSSPRPCSEINSMKGNVISGLSKVSNENRNPNVSVFGSGYGVSKSSIDVSDDFHGVHCVKGNSRFHGGNDDVKKFDLKGGNSVSQDVNELASVDVDLGGDCNQTEYSKGDPNLADKEGGKVSNSILNESKCPDLEHSVGKIVVDRTTFSGGEIVSSKTHDKEYDPNLLNFLRSDANQSIDTEGRDELGDSYSADTSKTVSETGDDGKKCDTGEVNMNSEDTRNGLDDHNADNFVLSQTGSIDCTVLPQSQESRVFGIERSAKSKEDECTNMTEGTNSIEACSCSFCTKAAYIWLDLHHKDIKARISALKKGQKDASILAERSCRIKADEKHGAQSVPRVSNLESNLMHQWRSLFKYMSNTWEDEGNQLEANLLQLNNLREKCKADLDRINAEQSEKH